MVMVVVVVLVIQGIEAFFTVIVESFYKNLVYKNMKLDLGIFKKKN